MLEYTPASTFLKMVPPRSNVPLQRSGVYGVMIPVLSGCLGHDRLERRAGRIDAGDCPVDERIRRVLVEPCQIRRIACGAHLVVVRRAHEGIDRTRRGIHHDRGAAGGVSSVLAGERDAVLHRLLGGALDARVDRQLQRGRQVEVAALQGAGDPVPSSRHADARAGSPG